MIGGDSREGVVGYVDVEDGPVGIDEDVVDAADGKATEPGPAGTVTVETCLRVGEPTAEAAQGWEP